MGTTTAITNDISAHPVQWFKHEACVTADPCVRQLIDKEGFEGYGRYWRLIELLCDSNTHEMPPIGARGYKRFLIGLGFNDDETLDAFLNTLISLDLLERTEHGCYRIQLVDKAVESLVRSKVNGSKGGRTAAANRKLRQG